MCLLFSCYAGYISSPTRFRASCGLTFTVVGMVVCDVVKFIPSPWKGEGEGEGSALSDPQGLDPLPLTFPLPGGQVRSVGVSP